MWVYFSFIAWGHLLCGAWSLIFLATYLDLFRSEQMDKYIEEFNKGKNNNFYIDQKFIIVAIVLGGYFSFYHLIKIMFYNTKS